MCRSILAVLTVLALILAAEANGQSEQPPGDMTTTRLEQLVTNRRAQLRPEHPDTLKSGLGDVTTTRLEQLVAVRRAQLGPKHPDTLHALSELADAYAQAGGADKALVLHRELFELRRDTLSDALQRLIAHCELVSRPEEVARWRAELEQLQSTEAAK